MDIQIKSTTNNLQFRVLKKVKGAPGSLDVLCKCNTTEAEAHACCVGCIGCNSCCSCTAMH
jgi:hypothetical protein